MWLCDSVASEEKSRKESKKLPRKSIKKFDNIGNCEGSHDLVCNNSAKNLQNSVQNPI